MSEIFTGDCSAPHACAMIVRGGDATRDGSWSLRYGQKHRMQRVVRWPAGITPPRKVRVYWRDNHWTLQWWEPTQRKNLAQRVDGDLVDAVAVARDIQRRLTEFRRSGRVGGNLGHRQLVDKFIADLRARADTGEIELGSVERYRSALTRHYLVYAELPPTTHEWPRPSGVNREFALGLAQFLANREVSPNGCDNSVKRQMRGTGFVWDAVRAMFLWAADPERGNLFGDGFRCPFLRAVGQPKRPRDPFGEPDITLDMAAKFLEACDAYQLRLFAPMIFYGLRASEPTFLFGEHVCDGWLRVPCTPELAYTTKGKRDKRLPLLEQLSSLLGQAGPGLLFVRRRVAEGKEHPPLFQKSLTELAEVFRRRCQQEAPGDHPLSAAKRRELRDKLLLDAGAANYDHIVREFESLARGKLNWPAESTLKDFRHLFATTMAATAMAEPYRQYLMGHATTAAAIGVYTHLNRLRSQYEAAVAQEMGSLVEVLRSQLVKLGC